MSSNIITVNYVVRNGEKYIRYFLDSLKKQTYQSFEVYIWDNNSTDRTPEIIKNEYPQFKLHESSENIGFWAGQEKLINQTDSKYIICLSDIILKVNFIEKAVRVMEANPDCGALQAKIYQMDLYDRAEPVYTNRIDTLGFKFFRSRKLINLGHGEEDTSPSFTIKEIFAVEGAVPIFRREALESCRIKNWIIDPDYRVGPLGYGDDLDLAWRMRLFGWKHLLAPDIICYHDRSTTKGYSKSAKDYLVRVKERRKIDIQKRRLDWRNTRFTITKNDYIINILKDLPYILAREVRVLGYTVLFEPKVLAEIPNFIKYLPGMIRKRREVMKRAKVSPTDMAKWFK